MDRKSASQATFHKVLEATEQLLFKTQAMKAKAKRNRRYDILVGMQNAQQKLFMLRKLCHKLNAKIQEK